MEHCFRFGFNDGTRLGMSRSICTPNFDEIPQSTAAISLLPVSENARPLYWNSTSSFDFDLLVVMGIGLPNFFPNRWTHGGVMTSYPFLPRCKMQTRYSDENSVCPSVRLSVRPSVRLSVRPSVRLSVRPSVRLSHAWFLKKTEERSVQIFTPYERTFILVYWEEEWLVGDDPLPEILGQPTPVGAKSPILNR